jgi:polysaccharide biosynthesis transport protein
MAFATWFSGIAPKTDITEAICEEQAVGRARNREIVFRVDSTYPLVVDPKLVSAVERFGVMRTRLLNAHAKSGLRTVMITSPHKEEGKSLVCMNLAISLGQLEKHRVLLVDGDFRVKGMTRLLNLQGEVGVSEYLQGGATFHECIRSSNFPHLSVASVGNLSEESLPAILEGSRWRSFLEEAKQQFDLILIDSVPVAVPIADFELLSAACDGILLVVQLRKTTRDALALSLKQLDNKLIGLVLNNTEIQARSDDYSHYYARKTHIA